ncbi:MAG: sensor histidine kinase N-terminal domain-containing protein [Proteobacteria bacterium]|nr:sensor histidine kinase N-terminal domain-containing protein [Pseudomonadota bacterium]
MSSPEPSRAPSLQRRLVIELSVALGFILVLLFLVLDRLVDNELYARMDSALLERTHTISAFLDTHPGPAELGELGRLLPEYEVPGHTDFFEVWNADGTSRSRSPSSADRPLARPPQTPAEGTPLYFDMTLPDGHGGRAVATMLESRTAGGDRRMLVVATEREPHDRLERRIHYTLMGGIALALALAVLIALLAVRRGLTPLLRFGERIATLDDTQPPARIAAEPLPRELAPFARALGTAFDKLYATIERERRFSRDVAHELRTPLTEIRTSIETAVRTPGDSEGTRAAFAASIGAVERMQRAIDALLMLARHEAGLAHPAFDPLDLSALLESLLDALGTYARERDIRFECACPPNLWIRSDVGSLERIVSNLLRNAIEYAPAGSRVDIGVEARNDGAITLHVANPAPNLSAEDLGHVGQRFWRKSPSGGTAAHAGLGLALALALARNLGLELHFTLERETFHARLLALKPL